MAWLADYTKRKKITIDNTKVDATLTDFPVRVFLDEDADIGASARSDGFDIRFTSSNGTTLLKYEREDFAIATNKATGNFFVKVPSVSSSADTEIYIYYGKSDATDGAIPRGVSDWEADTAYSVGDYIKPTTLNGFYYICTTAGTSGSTEPTWNETDGGTTSDGTVEWTTTAQVWDSNFKARYSMKDLTTSTIEDSTANNNDGDKKAANEPVEADGKIGKGQDFDGTDDYIEIPYNSAWNLGGEGSFGGWYYHNEIKHGVGLITYDLGDYKWLLYSTGAGVAMYVRTASGVVSTPNYAVEVEQWHHIMGVWDRSTEPRLRLYVDGELVSSASGYDEDITSSDKPILFGWWYVHYFKGLMDEVRISATARSAAWIKADYNSGNNSLLSLGDEESSVVDLNVDLSVKNIKTVKIYG